MTRQEHIDQIRLLSSNLNPDISWNDLCADVARVRGACMSLMVELHAEYIESIPRTTLVVTSPRLTVDDI